MPLDRHLWGIVLAAGSGTRLRSLTTEPGGVPVPKQFCSLLGPRSMLRQTLERLEPLIPPERTLAVVAARHDRWWRRDLAGLPEENILVQPRDRGTAAGILLPLLETLRRDPDALVASFPSDHFFEDEGVLARSVGRAVGDVARGREGLVLLGMTPETAETGFGWILASRDPGGSPVPVASFVEKPDGALAGRLMRRGALWNSFIWMGRAETAIGIFAARLPHLLSAFRATLGRPAACRTLGDLKALYDGIPSRDFSGDLLEGCRGSLWVLRVPPCGWSDLGTPERLLRCRGLSVRGWEETVLDNACRLRGTIPAFVDGTVVVPGRSGT